MEKFICVTPECRTSYMDIFQPKVWNEGEEGEYQVTMLFDADTDLSAVKGAVDAAIKDGHGDTSVQMPWRKGDDITDQDGNVRDGYVGKVVIKTTSKFPPIVIGPDLKQIDSIDADSFQSGDYAKVKVEAKAWEFAGKQGVKLYFKAIQKTKKGERFGGGNDISGFDAVTPEAGAGSNLF